MSNIWSIFKVHFKDTIIHSEYYSKWFTFLKNYNNNVLLYGPLGFPTDLYIDEILQDRYNIQNLHKTECTWGKEIIYYHNPYFLEINLMHPLVNKNLTSICKFLIDIIKNKNISNEKHCIIIKNIDLLDKDYFSSYRIILERYSNNVCFICTAHNIDRIDVPVKSRFALVRMPLFTHQEIINIFHKMQIQLNRHIINSKYSRDIIRAIFITQLEHNGAEITEDFCQLNFPPLLEFIDKKSYSITDVKTFSYKCFQYNITIKEIVCDLLKIKGFLKSKKAKINLIKNASDIEYNLKQAKKGREPIYLETFLCQVFL
jgi:DNA polymerase III delta prime subunit